MWASAVSLSVGFVGSVTVGRGGGPDSWAFLQWGTGLQVPMPSLPVSLWPRMLLWPRGRNQVGGLLSATRRIGHRGCCSRVTDAAFTVPPVLPPLCVPIYTHLDVRMCDMIWYHDEVVGGSFIELWCFSDCRLNGRQTEHLVPP